MLVGRRRLRSWRRVAKSLQALVSHGLLFLFTLLLLLKLDHVIHYSWWIIFSPLWIFHVVLARGRFSLPAPLMPHDRHWAPCHAIMATPLLVAFELLLCIHLESYYVVNLKIVFLPLLAFEVAILIDNIRMCGASMPGNDENMSDEAIWETVPHFWFAMSVVFFIAGTVFTLLKICGDVAALGWWDLFINFGLLGWWSIDEGSIEEQARLYCAGDSGYNTFSPDMVKKMPRAYLVEEIWRLQAALGEQTKVTKFSQEKYERLQNEKILCRVCFEEQINVVLLPCRHHILCSTCCKKCKRCPVCRVPIEERMPVYDV